MQAWADDRRRAEQEDKRNRYWDDIVRRVGDIERDVGTGTLSNHPGRDSMECIALRLAFLSGVLEVRLAQAKERAMCDITPEPDDQDDGDCETAGNLICLPGVKLADVLPSDGGRA